MKGQAAAVIIVLIVVAIVAVFIFSGQGGISLPGFASIQPVSYSNNVITISDKFVSDKSPFDGQKTTIEMTITNRGQGTAKDVEFSLEPPTGFTSDVRCGDGASCKFDLDEGDAKEVVVTLTANQGISQVLPVTVRYSVRYPYSGEKEVHIPVVGDKDDLPKGQSYFVSDPTFGPIQLSVTPPQSREASDGALSVFAVSGIPVKMDFAFSNVGGGLGSSDTVTMSGDDVRLTTSNLETVFCDKVDASTNSLKEVDKGFAVPFDFSCTFEPSSVGGLEDGVVKIEYDYVYRIPFTEQFTIVPREAPEVPSGPSGSGAPASSGGTGSSEGAENAQIDTIQEPANAPTSFTLSTDSGIYSSSDTVLITGSVPSSSGSVVTGRVFDPTGSIQSIFQEQTDSSGSFSSSLVLPPDADSGVWRIVATSGSTTKEVAISVN